MLSQVVVLVERHGPSTKRRMAFFSLSTMTHPFSRSQLLKYTHAPHYDTRLSESFINFDSLLVFSPSCQVP